MSSSETVSIEPHGGITVVRLNRPPANAIDLELAVEFASAFTAAMDDELAAHDRHVLPERHPAVRGLAHEVEVRGETRRRAGAGQRLRRRAAHDH